MKENNNEWQLITILRKMQYAGLPEVQSVNYDNSIDQFSFPLENDLDLTILDGKLFRIDYFRNSGAGQSYSYDSLDDAISKLKELLGGGDE